MSETIDCKWYYKKGNICGFYKVCPELDNLSCKCPVISFAREYEKKPRNEYIDKTFMEKIFGKIKSGKTIWDGD